MEFVAGSDGTKKKILFGVTLIVAAFMFSSANAISDPGWYDNYTSSDALNLSVLGCWNSTAYSQVCVGKFPIVITERANQSDLYDYPVRIVINYSLWQNEDMPGEFDYVQFVNNSNHPLNFWIEGSYNGLNLICYQETTNSTPTCGGLNTGKYGGSLENITRTYDGDWDSFMQIHLFNATFLYVNYSIPTNVSRQNSYWEWKDVFMSRNETIPEQCWNNSANSILQLKLATTPLSSMIGFDYYCMNNTYSWIPFSGSRITTPAAPLYFYEEGMHWGWANATYSIVWVDIPKMNKDENTTIWVYFGGDHRINSKQSSKAAVCPYGVSTADSKYICGNYFYDNFEWTPAGSPAWNMSDANTSNKWIVGAGDWKGVNGRLYANLASSVTNKIYTSLTFNLTFPYIFKVHYEVGAACEPATATSRPTYNMWTYENSSGAFNSSYLFQNTVQGGPYGNSYLFNSTKEVGANYSFLCQNGGYWEIYTKNLTAYNLTDIGNGTLVTGNGSGNSTLLSDGEIRFANDTRIQLQTMSTAGTIGANWYDVILGKYIYPEPTYAIYFGNWTKGGSVICVGPECTEDCTGPGCGNDGGGGGCPVNTTQCDDGVCRNATTGNKTLDCAVCLADQKLCWGECIPNVQGCPFCSPGNHLCGDGQCYSNSVSCPICPVGNVLCSDSVCRPVCPTADTCAEGKCCDANFTIIGNLIEDVCYLFPVFGNTSDPDPVYSGANYSYYLYVVSGYANVTAELIYNGTTYSAYTYEKFQQNYTLIAWATAPLVNRSMLMNYSWILYENGLNTLNSSLKNNTVLPARPNITIYNPLQAEWVQISSIPANISVNYSVVDNLNNSCQYNVSVGAAAIVGNTVVNASRVKNNFTFEATIDTAVYTLRMFCNNTWSARELIRTFAITSTGCPSGQVLCSGVCSASCSGGPTAGAGGTTETILIGGNFTVIPRQLLGAVIFYAGFINENVTTNVPDGLFRSNRVIESCTVASPFICTPFSNSTRALLQLQVTDDTFWWRTFIAPVTLKSNVKEEIEVPVRAFVINLAAWIGIGNIKANLAPSAQYFFKSENGYIIGIRLWWILLLLIILTALLLWYVRKINRS